MKRVARDKPYDPPATYLTGQGAKACMMGKRIIAIIRLLSWRWEPFFSLCGEKTMLQIKNGIFSGYIKMQPGKMRSYIEKRPELRPYVSFHMAGSHFHISIDDMLVSSTKFYRIEKECISVEEFDAFYSLAEVPGSLIE